jgi:phage gp46-like protein
VTASVTNGILVAAKAYSDSTTQGLVTASVTNGILVAAKSYADSTTQGLVTASVTNGILVAAKAYSDSTTQGLVTASVTNGILVAAKSYADSTTNGLKIEMTNLVYVTSNALQTAISNTWLYFGTNVVNTNGTGGTGTWYWSTSAPVGPLVVTHSAAGEAWPGTLRKLVQYGPLPVPTSNNVIDSVQYFMRAKGTGGNEFDLFTSSLFVMITGDDTNSSMNASSFAGWFPLTQTYTSFGIGSFPTPGIHGQSRYFITVLGSQTYLPFTTPPDLYVSMSNVWFQISGRYQ